MSTCGHLKFSNTIICVRHNIKVYLFGPYAWAVFGPFLSITLSLYNKPKYNKYTAPKYIPLFIIK